MLLISLKNRCGQSNLQRLEVEKFAGDMLAVSLPVGQCLKLWLHSWEKRAGDAVFESLGNILRWSPASSRETTKTSKQIPKTKKDCQKQVVKIFPVATYKLLCCTQGGVPVSFSFFSEKKPVKCWGWMLTAAAWVFRWDDFPMVLSWVWTLVWWTFGQIAM